MGKHLRHLPQSLQVAALALLIAPLAFFGLVFANAAIFARLPVWYDVYLVLTYAVIPLSMCVLMVTRQVAFLYLSGVECVAILLGVFLNDDGLPLVLRNLHTVYAMTLVGLSLMLINKDILFPFLISTYRGRGWRRAPRIKVNQVVKVYSPQLDRIFQLMIQDCSLSGMALYGYEDALSDLLADMHKGMTLVVRHGVGKTAFHVPLQVMWHSENSQIAEIGLMATDSRAMARFFDGLGFRQNYQGASRWLAAVWGKRAARKALNYAFAAAFLGLLLLPALSSVSRKRLLEARSWSALMDGVRRDGKKPVEVKPPSETRAK